MTTPIAHRWIIEPQTLDLKPEDGSEPPTMFTAQEWDQQTWPDCPVCGSTITVDRMHASSSWSDGQVFVMGRWQCPNGCDPRPVLRP